MPAGLEGDLHVGRYAGPGRPRAPLRAAPKKPRSGSGFSRFCSPGDASPIPAGMRGGLFPEGPAVPAGLPQGQPKRAPGQHPPDPRDAEGPGTTDTQGDRQQQRAKAHAEHQCRISVPENSHPTHGRGEAQQAILQQTAEYIFSLEQEKTRLLQQNAQLKRFIQEFSGSSPKRRRAEDKDEGIGSPDIWEDEKAEDLRREMIELRQQLDKERSVRMMLEEQVRSLEAHLYPEKLKVIAQQVQLQQQEQLLPAHGPPAPTQHPTVIVPAPPPPSHHVTVVTMGPSSVINTISTSRQNLDTIVQAIQHIEGTQEKQLLEEEEQRRGAVIVTPARASLDPSNSDTASDLEAEDNDSMEHSKAGMP
ncbi:transcription factor AP-4 isoform X2 [Ahaetulla prasina]|uniref:transcription factor AP-4 isoform X2 n=1 Tax=Ahaetulla prasina TaxID=499056 RepID=UPI0026480AC8|nr:transcription factor AP-4 isoform X2 [Ahaetulla prasina]